MGASELMVLVNGQPAASVEVADRGFQYGDGVFTTIAVREGQALLLRRHLARLERDCRRLAIPFPDPEVLRNETRLLCASRPDGVLKIQITRGRGGRGYGLPETASPPTRVLAIHPPPNYPSECSEEGVEVRICRHRLGINPALAGVKHMNRLEQILARAEWPSGEIREGLMLDHEGHVTEGTMTNLFLVSAGGLATPRLDWCGVAGVMRALVMEGAAELGLAVAEERILPERLDRADELFLTNSIIGIWPIRRIESLDYRVGPVTRELRRWLAIRMRGETGAECVR